MPTIPVAERIERRIEATPFGCWQWTGRIDRYGYGAIKVDRAPRPAHRVSFEAFVGPIAEGMQLDHLCRNRSCVNPDHLEQVDTKTNTRRGVRPNRLLCPNGHPRTPDNLYVDPSGARSCRTCHRGAAAAHRARQGTQGASTSPRIGG
ncbi:HNH endonuclease signature motif containing protein [Curtobacterium sp. MCLR17_042]|uniref:HNH endonuclease signature motif containing protein n=1 Tax=Curtobacterium sp. MCLR17_042 TaxID=2175626 RepID=UPI000DA7AB18|nr:HNH endonuclease [Curtobacterium sp. MCLR17_042]